MSRGTGEAVKKPLSNRHRKDLVGISDAVIDVRGYRTVKDSARLVALGFSRAQQRPPGLLVPNFWGKEVVGHQFRPDEPRVMDGKPVKYETPAGAAVRLDCPPDCTADVADPSVPLWITEGVKKADAAVTAGLCCLALAGVDCWRGTRADGTKGPLEDWDDVSLDGRDVVIAFDSDVMVKPEVRAALDALTRFLQSRGARVKWIHLPADGDRKVGLDDYFAKGGTVAELVATAETPRLAIVGPGRPLPDVTRDAIASLAAINDPPVLFRRGDALIESREVGAKIVDRDRLRYRLTESADWLRKTKAGTSPTDPPSNVLANVLAASDLWPFPWLDRIVSTPVFAADGTLRSEPGYHPASRSLYLAQDDVRIPSVADRPTGKEIRRARRAIDEMVEEFPFVAKADRAHTVALMLQGFARELIRGVTPIYGVEAPKQGTGKTVLVQTALAPAVGVVPSYSYPYNDEEMEKRLTASLGDAVPAIFFDNVTKAVSYPSLASAVTTGRWQGRILGSSSSLVADVSCTWVLTANNPQYAADLSRRVVRIRLDAQIEAPHRRSGFTHSLPADALRDRGQLIWAACTLVRAWVVAGRPAPPGNVPVLLGFGPWRRVLGGIVGLHGWSGFLGNLADLSEEDEASPDAEVLATILALAQDELRGDPFEARDIARAFADDADFAAALPPSREEVGRRIGKFLRDHKGQMVKGFRLEKVGARGARGWKWQFLPASERA